MNFYRFQLFAPVAFVIGTLFSLHFKTIVMFAGIALCAFPFVHFIINKISLFLILGLMRGALIHNIDEFYTYRNTSFIATVEDVVQREHGLYLKLKDFKFEEMCVEGALDANTVFPKHALMRLSEHLEEKIYNLDANIVGTKVTAFGRFLLPMPSALPELDSRKMPRGVIHALEIHSLKAHGFKTALRKKFNESLSVNSASLAKAILLGDTFAITQKSREKFQESGLAHLLGVSVLNIVMLATLFYMFFRFVIARLFYQLAYYVPLNIAGKALSLLITVVYCYLIGFEYPLLRSLLLSSFSLVAFYLGAGRNLEFLLLSASAIMLVQPGAIYDISFQLSFGAVLGLCCFENFKLKNRVANFLANAMFSSFCASLVIVPISLYHFQSASIQPFLANFFAIPYVSFVITPVSLLFMVFAMLKCEWIVAWLLDYVFILFQNFAILMAPLGANVHVSPFPFFACAVLIFAILLFAIFRKYMFLIIGFFSFLVIIYKQTKPPFILVHPYAVGLVLKDRIIIYPKVNYIGEIWGAAYKLRCIDGRNSQYFNKEDSGKLVVMNKIGIIFDHLKCSSESCTKDYIIPYSQQQMQTTKIII